MIQLLPPALSHCRLRPALVALLLGWLALLAVTLGQLQQLPSAVRVAVDTSAQLLAAQPVLPGDEDSRLEAGTEAPSPSEPEEGGNRRLASLHWRVVWAAHGGPLRNAPALPGTDPRLRLNPSHGPPAA